MGCELTPTACALRDAAARRGALVRLACADHLPGKAAEFTAMGLHEQRSPVEGDGRRVYFLMQFGDPLGWRGSYIANSPTFEAAVARVFTEEAYPGGEVLAAGFRAATLPESWTVGELITDPGFLADTLDIPGFEELRERDGDPDPLPAPIAIEVEVDELMAYRPLYFDEQLNREALNTPIPAGLADTRSPIGDDGRRVWWMLQFADDRGWLGLYCTDAPSMAGALARATATGHNPGGEVSGIPLRARSLPDGYADQLITDEEFAAAMPEPDGAEPLR